MATSTFRRDFLHRKLVTPASDVRDFLGRVCTATADPEGRPLFATVRANSTAYTLGAFVEFVAGGGPLMQATVAGTSAVAEPAVPAVGATVVDGGATWLRLQ